MDKRPKDESIKKDDPAKRTENSVVSNENLETDQRERGYYYDDAHGYQKYIPEEDSDENDTEE